MGKITIRKTNRTLRLLALLVLTYLTIISTTLPLSAQSNSSTTITNLRVQSTETPLAVEEKKPVFSWQMISSAIGQKQNAYKIVVTNERTKSVVWDSKKAISDLSIGILYNGIALEPETAYTWHLTVWDANDKTYTQTSRFETGLMNPKIEAWNGAKWIGSNKLILDATSACLFEINTNFQIKAGSKAASIILGANDFRFNESFQNIENMEGENYVRFELDISGVGSENGAAINIYRVGHGKNDSPTVPYRVISAEKDSVTNINKLITEANKNNFHNLSISIETGDIILKIDGDTVKNTISNALDRTPQAGGNAQGGNRRRPRRGNNASITISNYRTGNNFNTFPNLNSVGFASNPGDEVVYTNYKILNKGQSSISNNILFDATTGPAYSIFKGLPGVTVSTDGTSITIKNDSKQTIIGYVDPSYGSLTMLRTRFSIDLGKKVSNAKIYLTSMGSYEVYINGKRMGQDWFAPGMSQFRETLYYQAYDVTEMIENGVNCIGAILNSGWYTGFMSFTPSNFNYFGDTEALLAKLVLTFTDGTQETIVSDPNTWKTYKDGPIEYGTFFQGERYNANKEANISVNGNVTGWSTNSYNDREWIKAEIVRQRDWVKFDIVSRYDQPVRVAEIIQAKKVMEVHSNDECTYTYDMGVNMVGVPSITVPAGWLKKEDVVIIRYGEQLYPGFPSDEKDYINMYGNTGTGKDIAGRVLYETYRAALSTDFYIANGSNEVVIQPTTTYHGYQYIQITIPNHAGILPLANIKGLVLSSDKLPTGTYTATTSEITTGTLVNQLFKNIQRSQLGNFFTYPTDCPQRNERMGWTGDAQAYSRTGTYNSDAQNFYRQWMVALRNDQGIGSTTEAPGGIGSTVPAYNKTDITDFADGTTWAAAVCMVPWQLYIQYGDIQTIEDNIMAMMTWLDGMDFYDFSEKYTHLSSKTSGLSDWLAVDNNTPAELVNNAIYIYMMEVTSIMAEAIGRNEYAATLKQRHALAKVEWNEVYVDPTTGKTKNADNAIVHTQASYATPLNFNVFSEKNMSKAHYYLAELAANPSASCNGETTFPEYTITTGFSGTPNILPALSRGGNVKEAYNMIACTNYASWLYPVTKGATSVWERWNGYEWAFRQSENSMNSFNHFALGAVGQWMYEFQLGITTDHANGEAGYKHFILQPMAGGKYTSLKGSYDSNYGVISSSWIADGNGTMTSYNAVVPANTTATLYIPVNETLVNFKGINGAMFVRTTTHNNMAVAEYELSSGSFNFTITTNGVTVNTR